MDINAIRSNIKAVKSRSSTEYQRKLVLPSKHAPEEAARELDSRCYYCGALIIPRIETYSVLGVERRMFIWPDRHGCEQETGAMQAAAVRDAQAQVDGQEQTRLALLKRAGLVGWLGRATFETFQPREDWPEGEACKAQVMRYADDLLSGRLYPNQVGPNNWLILYGQYGNGKSHLAAAVIREALATGWHTSYFRVWTEYLKRLQASWNRRAGADVEAETEADIVAELQDGRLVVIDDLDKRDPTIWTRGVLFNVLNYRYNAELPTILTFNFGPDDADPKAPGRLALEDYLGRASLDRLLGAACDVVEFKGPSYRSGVKWGKQ